MYGERRWGGSVASAWATAAQESAATGNKGVRGVSDPGGVAVLNT